MAAIAQREDRHKNNLSIPSEPPATLDGESRDVFIVHRVMRGNEAMKQFTEMEKGVEKLFDVAGAEEVPHPLHHWAVAVGGIIHHLQTQSFFNSPNYYENKKLPTDEGYIPFKVGSTTFSDLAIQEAGVATIYSMPATYDPISNNCQRFTLDLVALIVRSGRVEMYSIEDFTKDVDAFNPEIMPLLRDIARGVQEQPEPALQKPVTAAVVEDPKAMDVLLKNVQAIMVENTPIVTPQNIEAELQKVNE